MIEPILSRYPEQFRRAKVSDAALEEAKNRVLDTLGCFYGAFTVKAARLLRTTLASGDGGEARLWGTERKAAATIAAWANGTCVRALDYNDTYLSKEPCHPSDLIPSLWAACELSGSSRQGRLLLESIVLAYEVLCRLCDATSLRARGWDHVTYLPIASAVGCAHALSLTPEQTRNAIALATTGNNALRQTRVGTISDWKAACASYAASAGLWAARLAREGFTGPNDVFDGRHGFFAQVSGPFRLSSKALGRPWAILRTHVKFFPAEHHAQSAIEAALDLRTELRGARVESVELASFGAAVEIIGSEKEKWSPTTRETADHSMPYLIAAALLDGEVTLRQYELGRYLNRDIRALMKRVRLRRAPDLDRLYPAKLPARLTLVLSDGRRLSREVLLPKGYAGRPLSHEDLIAKYARMATARLGGRRAALLATRVSALERLARLDDLAADMLVDRRARP